MQRIWVHPELMSGDDSRTPRSLAPKYTVSERRATVETPEKSALKDRIAVFAAGAALAALLTVASSLLALGRSDSNASSAREAHLLETKVDYPIGRTSFLEKIFSSQERELKGQMSFVSAIIEKQLNNHPNPKELALQIVTECWLADYDPVFVTAVINTESMFKHQAISFAGARGLMQIMPNTARYISDKENFVWRGSKELHEPVYNLKVGIAYLKYLEKKYSGDREKILIAYNWGPGNLEAAIKKGRRVPSGPAVYARKIIANHRKWATQLSASLAQNNDKSLIG